MTDQCDGCERYLAPRIDEDEVVKVFRVQDLPINRRDVPEEKKLCARCFTKWKESPPIGYIPSLYNGLWTLARNGEETEILSPTDYEGQSVARVEPKAARVKTDDDGDLVKAINRLAAAVESLAKKGK